MFLSYMKKQTIRLTESQIRNIVKTSIRESLINEKIDRAVNSVINEMMEEFQPGSISHGTMRMQDILPAFKSALFKENPAAARAIWKKYPAFNEALCDLEVGKQDNPFWESEEAQDVYDDFVTAFSLLAPEGHWFGTHPGDGSDVGFWPNDLQDA